MKINKSNLAKLNSNYRGYLEGSAIDKFFADFGIKFAAGHWSAGDFCDRFAPTGYFSDDPKFKHGIIAQMERVAKAGIKGIEFHEQLFIEEKNFTKVPAKIKEVKQALRQLGLTPTNMNINTWTHPKWKLGGITNANRSIRRDALAIAVQAVEIAKEVGCGSVALWPGSDGWDYNFEANYGKLLDLFVEGCIAINKAAKKAGIRFGIEGKLHEPREGNMIISTSYKAILVAKQVNEECRGKNMGIAVDYGHEQMYGNEPADVIYSARQFGVPLTNFHVNNAKLHSNDEDRICGTGDNWRLADFCYAAIDTDYQGWFGEDQFTYRVDPVKAMSLSREIFANVMKKALLIYAHKADLLKAQATGDAGKTIDVVKKYLV